MTYRESNMKKTLMTLMVAGSLSFASAEGLLGGLGAFLSNDLVKSGIGAYGGYALGNNIGPKDSNEREVAKLAGAALGAIYGPRLLDGILNGTTQRQQPQAQQHHGYVPQPQQYHAPKRGVPSYSRHGYYRQPYYHGVHQRGTY